MQATARADKVVVKVGTKVRWQLGCGCAWRHALGCANLVRSCKLPLCSLQVAIKAKKTSLKHMY
jgi:hypothetical protein